VVLSSPNVVLEALAVVPLAGKFRLYLNKAAVSTIYFSYLVIG